jgi:hypothetical protein
MHNYQIINVRETVSVIAQYTFCRPKYWADTRVRPNLDKLEQEQ